MREPEDSGWDGGWEDAWDSGEMGELMLGPHQRYSGDGAASASRWGSRHSIRSYRHSGDIENLAALEDSPSIADGARSNIGGLRPAPGWVPFAAPDNATLTALLRNVVIYAMADRLDVPARFLYHVLFGGPDVRAAAGLGAEQVHAMRVEYQGELAASATRWGIALPPPRIGGDATHRAAVVCDVCGAAVHNGRCRCS